MILPVPILFSLLSQGILETVERRTCEARERQESMMKTSGVLDPLTCPGIDLDKFRDECKAPLIQNAWNRWRLIRSNADAPSADRIESGARALLTWLVPGPVRHVSVKIGGEANPWGTPVILNRNSVCMTPMNVRAPADDIGQPYHNVYVEFVPRGPETHIVWPARKLLLPSVDKVLATDCPVNADWLLDAVFAPSQQKVPAEDSDSPLPPTLDPENKLPEFLENPEDEVPWWMWAGGALATAAVVAYVVRAFR